MHRFRARLHRGAKRQPSGILLHLRAPMPADGVQQLFRLLHAPERIAISPCV